LKGAKYSKHFIVKYYSMLWVVKLTNDEERGIMDISAKYRRISLSLSEEFIIATSLSRLDLAAGDIMKQ